MKILQSCKVKSLAIDVYLRIYITCTIRLHNLTGHQVHVKSNKSKIVKSPDDKQNKKQLIFF